jgi:integrase
VQVPEWLMLLLADTCPLEDRAAERRVFAGFTADVAKNAIARACKAAGIPHFHPHDLRHRRGSLWHGQGVPARLLADRLGHSRASMSLDVYSHVMPLDEANEEEMTALLVGSR